MHIPTSFAYDTYIEMGNGKNNVYIHFLFFLSISSIYLGTSMEKALTRFGSPSRSDTFSFFI